MKRAIQLTAICLGLLPVFAPAAPLYTDTLTYFSYPAGLNDGQVYVGLSAYRNSANADFLAWCIRRGVAQVPLNASYQVNVFAVDDPDLWSLLPATHNQLRIMAYLGTNFNNTNPNDAEVHHGIWEQLTPNYYDLTPSEQARVDAAAFFTSPGSPVPFSSANFLVAMPINWGTANSVGQPIMWEGGPPQGEEVVPEPGTMALLGTGILLVFLRRRR